MEDDVHRINARIRHLKGIHMIKKEAFKFMIEKPCPPQKKVDQRRRDSTVKSYHSDPEDKNQDQNKGLGVKYDRSYSVRSRLYSLDE